MEEKDPYSTLGFKINRLSCELFDFSFTTTKKSVENLSKTIAWNLPSSVIYYASVRLMKYATQGNSSEYNDQISELTCIDALARWANRYMLWWVLEE